MKGIAYIKDMETWKNGFSFFTEIDIRFSETDMFGHVNNVSAFIYFEQARTEYMKEKGLFANFKNPTSVPVVADLQCDYLRQIYFGQTIKLFVKTDSIGKSSLELHYMAVNQEGDICLTGRGRMVNVDPVTGNPVPLSSEIKQRLKDEAEVRN